MIAESGDLLRSPLRLEIELVQRPAPAADCVACQSAADTATRVACMDPTTSFVACEDAPSACQ